VYVIEGFFSQAQNSGTPTWRDDCALAKDLGAATLSKDVLGRTDVLFNNCGACLDFCERV
jgi:hypothetical protein